MGGELLYIQTITRFRKEQYMGMWELDISANDTYQEVQSIYVSNYNLGYDPLVIADELLTRYESDPERHLAYLSLADCLWHSGISCERVNVIIKQITDERIDEKYFISCGADYEMIKKRALHLKRFCDRLNTPAQEKELWLPTPSVGGSIKKGDIFWYRCKKAVYGAAVLDIQGEQYYFIALTDELDRVPQNIEDVISASFYTAAWFSDAELLPVRRMHHIGEIHIADDYNGRAGFSRKDNESVRIYNCGQKGVWDHVSRNLKINNSVIRDTLSKNYFPPINKSF